MPQSCPGERHQQAHSADSASFERATIVIVILASPAQEHHDGCAGATAVSQPSSARSTPAVSGTAVTRPASSAWRGERWCKAIVQNLVASFTWMLLDQSGAGTAAVRVGVWTLIAACRLLGLS